MFSPITLVFRFDIKDVTLHQTSERGTSAVNATICTYPRYAFEKTMRLSSVLQNAIIQHASWDRNAASILAASGGCAASGHPPPQTEGPTAMTNTGSPQGSEVLPACRHQWLSERIKSVV